MDLGNNFDAESRDGTESIISDGDPPLIINLSPKARRRAGVKRPRTGNPTPLKKSTLTLNKKVPDPEPPKKEKKPSLASLYRAPPDPDADKNINKGTIDKGAESEESPDDNDDDDDDGDDNNEGTDWSEKSSLRLVKSYIKHLTAGHSHHVLDRVLHELNRKGVRKFSREMVLAELDRLRKFGTEMLSMEGYEVEWPLMDEIKTILCLEGTAPIKVMREHYNAQPDVRWKDHEIHHLIEVYTDHLIVSHNSGQTRKKIWKNIMSDLDPIITQKFSLQQIKLRVATTRKRYFEAREKKNSGNAIDWPLYGIMEELYKVENEIALDKGKSPDLDLLGPSDVENEEEQNTESGDTVRWTWSETKSLLEAYTKYVRELNESISFKEKRKVWIKIASEVKMIRPRQCNPYLARMKVENMKKTWKKHMKGKGRPTWPYFSMMSKAMKAERMIEVGATYEEVEEGFSSIARGNLNSDIPVWMQEFAEESRIRHAQRMNRYNRLMHIMEALIASSQNPIH